MLVTATTAVLSLLPAPAAHAAPLGSTVADRYEAGREAAWVFEQRGERIGTCWSRYEGTTDQGGAEAHRFRARVALRIETSTDAVDQRFTSDLWTDAGGHPLRANLRLSIADVRADVELAFEGDGAHATVRQGPGTQEIDVDVPEGSFALANNFISQLELLLALAAPPEGGSETFPMVSINGLQPFELTVTHVERREQGGQVYGDSLGERISLDADGWLERVEIPAQEIVIRRTDERPEPFTIDAPEAAAPSADLAREDVRIEYDDVSLAGTITRPPGAEGPFPAVFFVSGSGGQDRDGYSSGIDIGTHEILDHLTRAGFLVLRVDDRGVGESRGPTEGVTFDDLVSDARHCVQFLRGRPDVDPERVAVLGHSEGGMTAPILAAELDLAAVVLLAAPARPVDALVTEQIAYQLELEDTEEAVVAEHVRAVEDVFARLRRGEAVPAKDVPEDLEDLLAERAWIESHLRQDPLANLRRVHCPVLVLQGGRDIQVSPERDARALDAALGEAEHPDHELVVFPELDHLFKHCDEERPTGLEYLKQRPVDPAFLDALTAWLGERLLE